MRATMRQWRKGTSRQEKAAEASYEELLEDATLAFERGDEDRAAELFDAAERVRASMGPQADNAA